MKFLLIPHLLREGALQLAGELARFMRQHGQEVCVLPEYQAPLQAVGVELPLFDGRADMAAVIGGDGTVLRSVRLLPDPSLPVWAVNFGHVGYLTDCEPAQALEALQAICKGEYTVERRCMLEGTVQNEISFCALNEAVIHRSSVSRALQMELSVSGSFVQTIPADGLLIATATGSTAYNLSAGGPILMPESDDLAITPICPHTFFCGSLVVSGKDEICIRVGMPASDEREQGEVPMLVVDGCEKHPLPHGSAVCIRRSERVLRLVRTQRDSFYRTLQKKLAQTI